MKCLPPSQLLFCLHYGHPRVCCTASVASLSSLVIRVRRVRRTLREEGCGGLPFWVRSWPFTSCSCRDRRSRSSATYTHSESMTYYALGTRRLLYTVLWEDTQSLNVFAWDCSLLSGHFQCEQGGCLLRVCSVWRMVCLLITQPWCPLQIM